jgi:acetyl esterase/lipase
MKYKYQCILIISILTLVSTYADEQTYYEYDVISSWTESTEIYKAGKTYSLKAYIFTSSSISENERRPAILFFHGGGWYEGKPDGFKRNCIKYAKKGWIGITFEYRLSNFKDINPIHCIMDAKSAVRWVRLHARRLHIDPDKIVVAGQSAGGHLALCTALVPGFDDTSDNTEISCIPNAIICYSACFDTKRDSWFERLLPDNISVNDTSPYTHLKKHLPPVLIFHGQKDEIVSYNQAADFHEKMLSNNNTSILYSFPGGTHNLWPSYHEKIRIVSENFLYTLGFIIKDS